jgi:DNA-directed RNA polymerase beta' subunit
MSLEFLSLDHFTRNLTPVTSTQIFTRTNEFHPQGIYSELIFGVQGSLERKKKFSYINLNTSVIHPSAYQILIRLDRKLEKMFSTEQSFILDKNKNLIQDDNGVTGISEFIKLFPKIKFRGETPDRDSFIEVLQKEYKKGTLFIDKIPVIPPEQRSIFKDDTGRWNKDPINDFYLTNLNKSIQIKSFGKKGIMYDLMNWGIQKSVNDLDDYIRTKVGKKYGLIRSSLLGKRCDFSGRAVITCGPDLNAQQIGIPFRLSLWLFEPFIIHNLLTLKGEELESLKKEVKDFTGLDLSVNSIMRVFKSLREGDETPKSLYDIFYNISIKSSEDRVVLAKRDPVLHAESVRAYYPVIVPGDTIQVSTLVVGGFNADFDGDQMAVFHPLTSDAQNEVKKRMLSGRSPNASDEMTFNLSKEMYVGLYLLTKSVKLVKSAIHITKEDLNKSTDPYIPVLFKNHTTTMGKAIFNSCFPIDFRFIEDQVKSKDVKKILIEIANKYGDDITKEVAFKLKNVGFKFATILSPSLNLEEITVPDEIYKLKKNLEKASTEDALKIMDKMKSVIIDHLEDTGLYALVESGSSKGWDHPLQIFGAKGLMADPTGKILPPVKGSLSDGLTPTEYFNAAGGARAGIIDRVINTADTGYTSRKLAFLLNSVELDLSKKDCGTDLTLDIKLNSDIIKRLKGRFLIYRNKIEQFDQSKFKIDDMIHLRSPIFCKSLKICHTCYGKLLELHKSPYVGLIAAQNIGERGTQLIMRTFHNTAIKPVVRDILKDIAENDPIINVEQLNHKLNQDQNNLYCLEDCSVTINLEEYKIGDNLIINEEDGTVQLNGLLSKMEFPDVTFDFILDYPVLLKYYQISKTKESIILTFRKDDELLEVPLQKQDIKELALYVERLISGKERFKDINHLFYKLYKNYSEDISSMDLVHLEVLLSQVLRDKNNPVIPARVGSDPEHPVLMNIKKNIFNSGLLQGLAFENVNAAINTGLITKTELDPSILEKLLTGTLVEKKKKEN